MAAPTALSTEVHVCEDHDDTFLIKDLLQDAHYTPTGAVRILQLNVLNPDGSATPAPTALVRMIPDGSGFVVTASALANWNGNFNTLSLVFEEGGLVYNIAVKVVVDPVNDAPEGADKAIAVVDGSGYVLKQSDFGFTDRVEDHAFKSVRITTTPTAGQLLLNGTALGAGAEVTVEDIDAGRLRFVPAAGNGGDSSFTFQVRDAGGTDGCDASDLDATPNTLSFTMPATSSIGDRVWNDTNRNGVQDVGEAGVGGVSVLLMGAGKDGVWGTLDDVMRTTTTAADGSYSFGGLNAGLYQVVFGGKTGYEYTTANAGSNDVVDSDASASGSTGIYTLGHNESNLTVDAGLREIWSAALGDRVWIDTDRDGVQDSGELGVSGVAVTLAGAGADGVFGTADDISRSTTTDANGNYLFNGLSAGRYQVTFGGKSGYQFTTADVGSDATDSDANIGTGKSQVVALAIGESNLTVDAGLMDAMSARLGDRVWFDADADGIQDAGEAGIAGVAVQLLQGGAVIASTVTSSTGNYLFSNLAAGQYQVQFGGKTGNEFTTANVGDDAADSDAATTGRSQVVTLAAGESNLTVDAGLKDAKTAALGDRVWIDTDRDGVQDSGELGVSGVAVVLAGAGADGVFGTADDISRGATTDANGNYLFSGLSAGQYQVTFGGKSGYQFTTADVGGDATDSDANTSTGKSQVVTLAFGESNLMVDAGLVLTDTCSAQLGDRVWLDADRDGVQDSGELGVSGVAVTLAGAGADGVFGTADDISRSTTTDANGNYLFSGLSAGQYQVTFGGKSGYQFTTADVGSDATDSDANIGTGKSQVVALAIGESNLTVDAGLMDAMSARLGDRVWFDADADGIQDAGEAGIAGVAVQLLQGGAVIASTVTSSTGNYLFSNLAAGQYQVQFGGKTGNEFTTANVGDDAADSDAATTGRSQVVTLAAGESNLTVDAGLKDAKTAALGDRVWIDTDRDGVQDSGELGVSGVAVVLAGAGADGVFGTADDISRGATTDANGNYLFSGLSAGQYQVTFGGKSGYQFTTADVGGDATDSDANTSTGKSQVVTLAFGESNLMVDAGLVLTDTCSAQLGDRVWLDADRDGVQDSGELGVSGVAVTLAGAGADGVFGTADDISRSTATDANGNYLFNGLSAGRYQVTFGGKSGYQFTTADVGSDATDSDANVGTGKSQVVTLAIGESNLTVDAGVQQIDTKTGKIGDRVWYDTDRDGIQDSNETGVAGHSVYLSGAGADNNYGTADDIYLTTTTDAAGNYLFTGLAAGYYTVAFNRLSGYDFTVANAGGNDATDSDVDARFGTQSDNFWLGIGETNLTVDAGLVLNDANNAQLGDRVWLDANRNGQQDTGEAGVSGVTVRLQGAGADGYFYTSDDIYRSATTDANGNYLFSGLAAGQYSVTFDGKAGYDFTTANVGNDATDSDHDPNTSWIPVYTLAAGQSNLTVDAGLVLKDTNTACIGDRVWYDTDRDGVQDSNETGAAGVSVGLLNAGADGTLYTTDDYYTYATTNSAGYYSFTGLAAGQYRVTFGGKTGYVFTTADATTDTVDSDANTITGSSQTITLGVGESNMTIDAGLAKKGGTACLGDRVWADFDSDGIQDTNETSGIRNVKVSLYDDYGGLVATTWTDSNGKYLFTNLDAGYYSLTFDRSNASLSGYSLSNWTWSSKDRGSSDATDSDVYSGSSYASSTPYFYLSEGQSDMTRDAGLSPIVIDLNGDGIRTIARGESDATFDLFGNGHAVQSGWISGSDGFLAVDRNGNGKVDDISELFGGSAKGLGFAQLANFDSNGDGVVDARDSAFDELRVWQDVDGDHQTDDGELMTLTQAGVAALTVDYTDLPFVDAQGNLHLERSSAQMADGTSVDMTDVYFNVDAADAQAAGVALPTMAELLGSDNALFDNAFGIGSPSMVTSGASSTYADTSEAQLAMLAAMKQIDTAMAVAC